MSKDVPSVSLYDEHACPETPRHRTVAPSSTFRTIVEVCWSMTGNILHRYIARLVFQEQQDVSTGRRSGERDKGLGAVLRAFRFLQWRHR